MKRRLLFLQLPQLDNDLSPAHENLPLAAQCLWRAACMAGEDRRYEPLFPPPDADTWDDARLVDYAVAGRPDVVAVSLYLWNVERSLQVLRELRRRLPGLRVVVGGPEVARAHPFLFRGAQVDAAVVGEGEAVFPALLAAFRGRTPPDFRTVAWRAQDGRLQWGQACPPEPELREVLPLPDDPQNQPDAAGIAYLETTRGCPLRCAFCCYSGHRRRRTALGAAEVLQRIEVLAQRGAREIRFIDPTFNSNPAFEEIVRGVAASRRAQGLRFFAELRADILTREQTQWLAQARFTQVEVGLQSRSPAVLRAVRRPADSAATEQGILRLAQAGIAVTVDVMCGLPEQTEQDVRRSLQWAAKVCKAQVQFLHTLLIPGTWLRQQRCALGLVSQPRPPYRVLRTPQLTEEAMRRADRIAERVTGRSMDCRTRRFVGRVLPDLFEERVVMNFPMERSPDRLPGFRNRRAVLLQGQDLFAECSAVQCLLRNAVRKEPHALWQFVLAPETEEPLDLLEAMVQTLDRMPSHLLDRLMIGAQGRCRAARRVMIQLHPRRRYDPSWIAAAEEFLSRSFH